MTSSITVHFLDDKDYEDVDDMPNSETFTALSPQFLAIYNDKCDIIVYFKYLHKLELRIQLSIGKLWYFQ